MSSFSRARLVSSATVLAARQWAWGEGHVGRKRCCLLLKLLLLQMLLRVFGERRSGLYGRGVVNDDGEGGMAALWRLGAPSIVLNVFAQELVIDVESLNVSAAGGKSNNVCKIGDVRKIL